MVEDGFLYNSLKTYEEAVCGMVEAFRDLSGIANEINSFTWIQVIKNLLNQYIIGTEANTGIMMCMEGIAFAIAMSFFLINIIQLAMEEKLTPEYFVKNGAKLAVAVAGIMWCPAILETIVGFGEAFGNMFAGTQTTLNNIWVNLDGTSVTFDNALAGYRNTMNCVYNLEEEEMYLAGFMSELAAGLKVLLDTALISLFTMLLIPILKICMTFTQITRYIELYVRGAFLPIAVGLMSEEGWRGPGGRYIRKIMSVACQNAAIFMALNITGVMLQAVVAGQLLDAANLFKPTVDGHFGYSSFSEMFSKLTGVTTDIVIIGFVVSAAGIAFMFKSLSVMDDLWGAR